MLENRYEIEKYSAVINQSGFRFEIDSEKGEWCKYQDIKELVEEERQKVGKNWATFHMQVSTDLEDELNKSRSALKESARQNATLQLWMGILSTICFCLLITAML
jgi:hypothetical protein